MLMPALLRQAAGAAPCAGSRALGRPGVSQGFKPRPLVATVRGNGRADTRRVARRVANVIVYRIAHLGIVGGFSVAPMLCVIGVVCLLLPAAQALQGSAGTFITVGTLWTVLAIIVTHLRPVGPNICTRNASSQPRGA